MVGLLRRDNPLVVKRIVIAAFLFLAVRIVSVSYSPDFERSVNYLQYPVLGLLFFLFIDWKNSLGRENLKLFEQIWFWAAVAAAVVGIVKYGIGIEARIGPPLGAIQVKPAIPDQPALGSYSLLAKYLTMTLLYFGTVILMQMKSRSNIYRVIGITLLGIALLLTFSRSCWLAVGFVVSALTLWMNRKLFMILAVSGVVMLLALPYGRDRVRQSINPDQWSTGRSQLWGHAFDKMEGHLLIGNGLGSFKSLMTDSERNSLSDRGVGDWHNQYIQIMVENGIVGLLLYLWLLLELFRGLISGFRNVEDQEVKGRFIAGIAVLSAAMIFSLFETFMSSPVGNVTFFSLMGITVGWLCSEKELHHE